MRSNYNEIKEIEDDIEVLIQGVIDLAIINDEDAIIVDFKTKTVKWEDRFDTLEEAFAHSQTYWQHVYEE